MKIYLAGITGMDWSQLLKIQRERVISDILLTYANIKVFPKLYDNEKKTFFLLDINK
jgi:hypothetical protein